MKDPSFLFYYKDFLIDTATFSAEELGWYIRLLCQQAEHHRLQNDMDQLARLAMVAYADYERFTVSWKRTLSKKFGECSEPGFLYNRKLRQVMSDRAAYSMRQKLRGLRGSYAKKLARMSHKIKDSKTFLDDLIDIEFFNSNDEERSVRFQHKLEAYLVNANVDVIVNKEEREKGEFEGKEIQSGKWPDSGTPEEALRSNGLRYKQVILDSQYAHELPDGIDHWIKKWSLAVINNEDNAWRSKSWQQLSSSALKYLMSSWSGIKRQDRLRELQGGKESIMDKPIRLES